MTCPVVSKKSTKKLTASPVIASAAAAVSPAGWRQWLLQRKAPVAARRIRSPRWASSNMVPRTYQNDKNTKKNAHPKVLLSEKPSAALQNLYNK